MKTILFILSLLVSSLANAQDVFQSELYPADLVLKHRLELDLSTEQINHIKSVYNTNMTKYNSLKWDLDVELAILINDLSLVKIDSTSSLTQMKNILAIETELKNTKLSLLISIKNQLNENQQQRLKKIRSLSSEVPFNFITPINENPRVVLKVDGPEIGSQPVLYIVDKKGNKQKTESVKGIEPNMIESITVLKGEGATKLYGKEGENGVVIIYLKKNK